MVKVYDYTRHIFEYGLGDVPPSKPLSEGDPEPEESKWNWRRIKHGTVPPEIHPDTPLTGGQAESDDKPDWRGVIKNNVIPLEPATKYDFGQPEIKGYYYFDTPDYADPFKKMWWSTKFLIKSGLILGCSIGITFNMPFNIKSNRYIWNKWVGPWLLGGIVGSLAVPTVANLRGQKDDMYNYVAAGLLAGAVTGRASYISHLRHTAFWLPAAVSAKYTNENNMVVVPIVDLGRRSLGIQGNSAENGILSGNMNIIRSTRGDPGRDTRSHPM